MKELHNMLDRLPGRTLTEDRERAPQPDVGRLLRRGIMRHEYGRNASDVPRRIIAYVGRGLPRGLLVVWRALREAALRRGIRLARGRAAERALSLREF